MEKNIEFEGLLYDQFIELKAIDIGDIDFWVDRISFFPGLRPHKLAQIVNLCLDYCQNSSFKEKLLLKSIVVCPVLVHRLFQSNIYMFSDIEPLLYSSGCFVSIYYFWKEIKDFDRIINEQRKPFGPNTAFPGNKDMEQMIEYGFVPSSLEYCLKYDDLTTFRDLFSNSNNTKTAKWNPFEWSRKPHSLDLLSFSGFFGSIQCFKFLLMNGFSIFESVQTNVVCCGNIDLFHMCNEGNTDYSNHFVFATEFDHLSLVQYLIEQGYVKIGDASLHIAAVSGHLRIIQYLLSQGVNINGKDSCSYTPLHYAVWCDHLLVVKYLVNNGANINEKEHEGSTPLHLAQLHDHQSIIDYLEDMGACVD